MQKKTPDTLRIHLHKNIFAMDLILTFVMELTCFPDVWMDLILTFAMESTCFDCHLRWNEQVCIIFHKLQC